MKYTYLITHIVFAGCFGRTDFTFGFHQTLQTSALHRMWDQLPQCCCKQANHGGANRYASHGGTGKWLPRQKHSCLPWWCVFLYQPIRWGGISLSANQVRRCVSLSANQVRRYFVFFFFLYRFSCSGTLQSEAEHIIYFKSSTTSANSTAHTHLTINGIFTDI